METPTQPIFKSGDLQACARAMDRLRAQETRFHATQVQEGSLDEPRTLLLLSVAPPDEEAARNLLQDIPSELLFPYQTPREGTQGDRIFGYFMLAAMLGALFYTLYGWIWGE